MKYFILKDKQPVQVEGYKQWKDWVATANREVKRSELVNGVTIVTEFLGQVDCLDDEDPPLLFETMIRGGIHDGMVQQYSTWKLAEEGHEKALQLVSSE